MLAYGIEVSFESLLQCIHVRRPASAMAGTCGGPVFCVCWHGRGIKDREVNGMKHRILTVCLLLALLLTACGGQNREPENPPDAKPSAPGEEAAEPPDETPEPEPAKPEEKEPLSLEDVLTDIYTVAPGTAGRALCGPPMPPENCWTGSM